MPVATLDRLPSVREVTAQGSGLVLNILAETGQSTAALRYAYDALRAYPGSTAGAFLRERSKRCNELVHRDGGERLIAAGAPRPQLERDTRHRGRVGSLHDRDEVDVSERRRFVTNARRPTAIAGRSIA